MTNALAYLCFSCGDYTFVGDAVRLYECSRCGTVFSQDEAEDNSRRCSECNIFLSKIADVGCEECRAEFDSDPVPVWRDGDGGIFESKVACREWHADQPRREAEAAAEQERLAEELKRRSAEMEAEAAAKDAVLRPKVEELLRLLAGRAEKVEQALSFYLSLKASVAGGVQVPVALHEIVALFGDDSLKAVVQEYFEGDYSWEEQKALRDRVIDEVVSPLFVGSPTSDHQFLRHLWGMGGSISFGVGETVDSFLGAFRVHDSLRSKVVRDDG
jgi:protein-arginine kinase activator protein McsA